MTSREGDQFQDLLRTRSVVTTGNVLGALASLVCCILPLVLFTVGATGPWIGKLVRLAPYQSYFLAATLACLGCGFLLVNRSSRIKCMAGPACGSQLTRRLVNLAMVLATVLVVAAIGLHFLVPWLNS